MIHEPRGTKYERQEPEGSTSDHLTLILKKIFPNYNCQDPGGFPSERLLLILNII